MSDASDIEAERIAKSLTNAGVTLEETVSDEKENVPADGSAEPADASDASDVKSVRDIVLAQNAANDAELQKLIASGVQLDTNGITMTRLVKLIDFLLGPLEGDGVTVQRVAFEKVLADHFTEIIENIKSEVTRQRLTAGVRGVNLDQLHERGRGPIVPGNGNGRRGGR